MKYPLMILFLLFCFPIVQAKNKAKAANLVFFYEKEQKIQKKWQILCGVRISENSTKESFASKVACAKKINTRIIKYELGGKNPASIFCQKLAGAAKIVYLSNLDEISICLFNDNSHIVTWDVIKHFSK